MFSRVTSAHVSGIDATEVQVEADINLVGMPFFTIVGLAEGAVKESKERVRSALRNIDYDIFAAQITLNLAPADLKKDGGHYDLPIAIGLLAAMNPKSYNLDSTLLLGELSLDGALRGVSGVLCMCAWAKNMGIKRVVLPYDNADEAALVQGIDIYPFHHLSEAIDFLRGEKEYPPYRSESVNFNTNIYEQDFSDIKGQFAARRAAEIAAAGMHNIIMVGSPGSGKTMIARRIPSILPPMSMDEALLTTKVHSVAGLLRDKGALVIKRPFIAPHHTASNVAIIGGGSKAMPGHVSIATHGVLFMDEMLEFNRSVLEVLRQPLEDNAVTIARAGRTVTYPANFMLVAACNPCPCGYHGDARKPCSCTPQSVTKYQARLSGPLLDRIDLHIHLIGVEFKDLESAKAGESSEQIRERVAKAHEIQKNRFKDESGVYFNAQMSEKLLQRYAPLDSACKKLMGLAMDKYTLSARAYGKIIKTARTIADLAGSTEIASEHVAEALQYRILDK
ncbi:MAG: YifB family Mg chelatase-like AAA ATPase [Deferribacteraceae bacterium]|jgi:magnesium chelatase family protein|nr:YifB family Mg chelatase-like AAA ATPase [Deferribacteraceae bacterium]